MIVALRTNAGVLPLRQAQGQKDNSKNSSLLAKGLGDGCLVPFLFDGEVEARKTVRALRE
jgi:hypothetical protein